MMSCWVAIYLAWETGAFLEAWLTLQVSECLGLAGVGTAGEMTAPILPLDFYHYPRGWGGHGKILSM